MLDEAQKKYDELVEKHEKELKAFDEEHGLTKGGSGTNKTNETVVNTTTSATSTSSKIKEKKWNDLSKKELEEECGLRGISKKGGKEELITRLVMWTQEQQTKPVQIPTTTTNTSNPTTTSSNTTTTTTTPTNPQPTTTSSNQTTNQSKKNSVSSSSSKSDSNIKTSKTEIKQEDDDEEDEDDDEEEDSESSEEEEKSEMSEEQKVEAEKQFKREQIVRKALKAILLQKYPKGFAVDKLAEKLLESNVKNFKPESLVRKSFG